jgi:transcriptional regulator with XRE-family HTH domain
MQYSQKKIAYRIKTERESLGMTKEQFALELGVNRNTITAWERSDKDGRYPSLGDLANMCKMFNCEMEYMLGELSAKTRETTDICKETGLSGKAVEELSYMNKNKGSRNNYSETLGLINQMLGENWFEFQMVLSSIRNFITYDKTVKDIEVKIKKTKGFKNETDKKQLTESIDRRDIEAHRIQKKLIAFMEKGAVENAKKN